MEGPYPLLILSPGTQRMGFFLFFKTQRRKTWKWLETPFSPQNHHHRHFSVLLSLPSHGEMAEHSKQKRSMAHSAGRGHTHQSVHSLHRTQALPASHSSCSCLSPPSRSHSSYWEWLSHLVLSGLWKHWERIPILDLDAVHSSTGA